MPDDEDTPMDAAAEAAEEAPPVSDEPAPPEVNQDQLKELTEMGFGECRAVRALHFTENNGYVEDKEPFHCRCEMRTAPWAST